MTGLARKLIPLPLAKTGSPFNVVAVVHYEDSAKQRSVAKVARGPKFGHALKQTSTCRHDRCDPPHASERFYVTCSAGRAQPPGWSYCPDAFERRA